MHYESLSPDSRATFEVQKLLIAVMAEFITPGGTFDVTGEGISLEEGLAKAMQIDRMIADAEARLGVSLRLAVLREIEKYNSFPAEDLEDSFWARVMLATKNPFCIQSAKKHPTQRLTRVVPPPVHRTATTWQDSFGGLDKSDRLDR